MTTLMAALSPTVLERVAGNTNRQPVSPTYVLVVVAVVVVVVVVAAAAVVVVPVQLVDAAREREADQ